MGVIQEINHMVKKAYQPMYATKHSVGSFRDNMNALKNWRNGHGPALNTSFATYVNNDNLNFDMSSISAPTLVDRIHGWWDGFTGKRNPYGTHDAASGKDITPQQFDANVQAARMPTDNFARAPKPGEFDGSWTQDGAGFRKGNTVSYPLDGEALAAHINAQMNAGSVK